MKEEMTTAGLQHNGVGKLRKRLRKRDLISCPGRTDDECPSITANCYSDGKGSNPVSEACDNELLDANYLTFEVDGGTGFPPDDPYAILMDPVVDGYILSTLSDSLYLLGDSELELMKEKINRYKK